MIRTKDLVEYMEKERVLNFTPWEREYKLEIVARLRAFDKLKESIENLLARMSNEVNAK